MIAIRIMNEAEIPAVSRLLYSCYRWLGQIEGLAPDSIDFLINKRGSIDTIKRESKVQSYLVACYGTIIVGMVAVRENEITRLYVDPSYHRNGIGRLLFTSAEKLIAADGHLQIILGTLGDFALPFYKSMGMIVSGSKLSKLGNNADVKITLLEKSTAGGEKE